MYSCGIFVQQMYWLQDKIKYYSTQIRILKKLRKKPEIGCDNCGISTCLTEADEFTPGCLRCIMCLYVISSVLWCPLRFSNKTDVRFVFTSGCLWEGSCLIHIICVCLCIVVSNTYCVMFLICFSSSCVPYVASFSRLSILDCPFGIL
jgi:hypothetical protein